MSDDGIGRRDPYEGVVGLATASLERLNEDGLVEIEVRLGPNRTPVKLRRCEFKLDQAQRIPELLESFACALDALELASQIAMFTNNEDLRLQCEAVARRGRKVLLHFREDG